MQCRCNLILQATLLNDHLGKKMHFLKRLPQCAATFLVASKTVLPVCAINVRSHCRTLSHYVNKIRHLQMLKENGEFCKRSLENAKFAVFYGLKPLMQEGQRGFQVAWMDNTELKERLNMDVSKQNLVLLDCEDTTCGNPRAHFAVNIAGDQTSKDHQKSVEVAVGGTAMSMRKAIFMTSHAQSHLISQGHAYLQWHYKHQFCPSCGTTTHPNQAGTKRECPECSETSFPTMSPVAITLVTNDDQCLVARQPQFPKGMYSALAGFCEPGEMLEDAVRREVAEEVGLDIGDITYYSSQHWPFPSSALMLACFARIKAETTTEFTLDTNEIEDARWLHRDEVRDIIGVKGGRSPEEPPIWLPPSRAIAHHLLKSWALL